VAAEWGHREVLTYLLQSAALAQASNDDGETPLHLAAAGGHLECVRKLLEYGASAEAADRRGLTPYLHALRRGHRRKVDPERLMRTLQALGTPLRPERRAQDQDGVLLQAAEELIRRSGGAPRKGEQAQAALVPGGRPRGPRAEGREEAGDGEGEEAQDRPSSEPATPTRALVQEGLSTAEANGKSEEQPSVGKAPATEGKTEPSRPTLWSLTCLIADKTIGKLWSRRGGDGGDDDGADGSGMERPPTDAELARQLG
jgi:hypothetical protein